jgi:N utilization substance protein A
MFDMGNLEILQIADTVAKEKGIIKDKVIEAMEESIEVASRKKYGHENNIEVEISRKDGEVKIYRVLDIVEDYASIENNFTQITLQDAQKMKADAEIGGKIYEPLPPIDLGRVSAQTAKQIITQKVREAERERQYEDFKDRVGEIVNGVVKRVEYGNIIVELGRAEAVVRRDQLIQNETYKINDRIKAYIQEVSRQPKGPQIFLSRTCEEFLAKLFEQEVPEIYDGVIEIKAISRDPGSKAKMAVYTEDRTIDTVGTCVGMRGARVKGITDELMGEKIDIIEWSDNLATFIVNALTPADISKVIIDEENSRVEVIVAEDQFSSAIGRKGQNVRLASKLTGWKVDVLTEEDESKRRTEEFNTTTKLFMEALDMEEVMAQLLAAEGYNTVEQIAEASEVDLEKIEGFDEDLAKELISRANEHIEKRDEEYIEKLEGLGVTQDVIDYLPMCSPDELVKLAENGIKTLEDLAEITTKEIKQIMPEARFDMNQMKEAINLASQAGAEEEASKETK